MVDAHERFGERSGCMVQGGVGAVWGYIEVGNTWHGISFDRFEIGPCGSLSESRNPAKAGLVARPWALDIGPL